MTSIRGFGLNSSDADEQRCMKMTRTPKLVKAMFTINVKYLTHDAYIEYDNKIILNFSMHNSTSTQNVLKVSSLKILSTHFEYIVSTCTVVHTKIKYIILYIGAVR